MSLHLNYQEPAHAVAGILWSRPGSCYRILRRSKSRPN